MANESEYRSCCSKVRELNKRNTLCRGIFTFEPIKKDDSYYNLLPDKLTRNTKGCNVLVRLINSIHKTYHYGFDTIDFSLPVEKLAVVMNDLVDDICRENINQLDIIFNRETETAYQAREEYTSSDVAKEVFENALQDKAHYTTIETARAAIQKIDHYPLAVDTETSNEQAQAAIGGKEYDKYLMKIHAENRPQKACVVSVHVKNIFYITEKGKYKKGFGFEIVINGERFPIFLGSYAPTFLYICTLMGKKTGRHINRADFTLALDNDITKWYDDLFHKCSFHDPDFKIWYNRVNLQKGKPLDDILGKANKAIWHSISESYPEAFYYLNIGYDKKGDKDYKVKLSADNIHFDSERFGL